MKTLKFLAVLSVVLGFAVNTAQSQALVIKTDLNPWFSSVLDDGTEVWYPATHKLIVGTPSGNIMATFTFQLDKRDVLVPDHGVRKIVVNGWIEFPTGVWRQVTDEIIITSAGMFKTVNFILPGKEK
jgi:hypothetical protein